MMPGKSLVVGIVTALVSLLPATGAGAHNGVGAFFQGHAGRYLVYAYDPEPLDGNRVEYQLVLLKGATEGPVYDVTTTVTAHRVGETGTGPRTATAEVTTFGNVVFAQLPNPYPSRWALTVSLSGRLGAGTTSFRAHGLPPTDDGPVVTEDDATPAALWAVAGVAAAFVIGLIVWILRRRRPGTSPRE